MRRAALQCCMLPRLCASPATRAAAAAAAAAPAPASPPTPCTLCTSSPSRSFATDSSPASSSLSSSSSAANPASPGPSSLRLMLRDFIQQSLYHPTRGYFNRHVPVVGRLDGPMNFWQVYNKQEWNIVIGKKYKELQVSFLTPVELFTPWYGYILARHILEHRKHHLSQEGQPLQIYEIGGGNGTLARDILDWLRDNRPEVYQETSYTCIEISSRLAAQQYNTIVTEAGHQDHFHMLRGNAWDRSTWGPCQWSHCIVLAMEVLDNLPHDRVFRPHEAAPWQQTEVQVQGGQGTMEVGPWEEVLAPLTDPQLMRCMAAVYRPPTTQQRLDEKFNKLLDWILVKEGQQEAAGEVVFAPTGSMTLLETLHAARPNHSLIAADFSHLPDVKIAGKNAPLVAEKTGGKNIDHPSLYVPWGTADIFFPTDFDALDRLYRATAEHVWGAGSGRMSTAHYHQGAVMKRYKEMAKTATISAFNPMVDDFLNARFFMGDSQGRLEGGGAGSTGSTGSQAGPGAAAAEGPDPAGSDEGAEEPLRLVEEKFVVGRRDAVAEAAAAAAEEAVRIRQQRSRDHEQVQPDPSGLPPWAQEKLKQQQQQAAEQAAGHKGGQDGASGKGPNH